MVEASYAISGMTCNGCRGKVAAALERLAPGAVVTLAPPRAVLRTRALLAAGEVQAAVSAAGR